ncbi:YcfA-like protein [Mycobacterium europaeum]|uniref:YcfA-like protein n=1 Tax=Mycobacterium europaeum TaxID=761804 RepID=A0A0U1CX42_9MYCO|nr:type II toxin-antitoxin system HicA family toxin [Mycobacterium europaeum]CQD03719.1 YcfA-like protein [Mycobacterium europaeum]
MIAPAPTREIVKQLKNAGFTKRDGKGSHTIWTCPHGRYKVSVDTGHKTISPGVRRQIDLALNQCDTDCKEDDA